MSDFDTFVKILQEGYYWGLLLRVDQIPGVIFENPDDAIDPVILSARSEEESESYKQQNYIIGQISSFVDENLNFLRDMAADIWSEKMPPEQGPFVFVERHKVFATELDGSGV